MALLRAFADLIFPPVCQVCRQLGTFPLCPNCRAEFRPIAPPVCRKCGKPLQGPPNLVFTCVLCRHRPAEFDRARAAGIFDGTLREAIHALKFHGCRPLAKPLGRLITAVVAGDPRLQAEVVIPVPLHPRRLRGRGFNQAELLGAELARSLHLPMITGVLVRQRDTSAQTGLGRADRRANVQGAFAVARTIGARTVLLVDDVMSTGVTAGECAKVLRCAGARRVVVATAALAVLDP